MVKDNGGDLGLYDGIRHIQFPAKGLHAAVVHPQAHIDGDGFQFEGFVEELLQPAQTKSFSQAMLETLSIIAYRQPVTRSDIEAVRGVRCDYSVSQLLKLGLIQEMGRKDSVGRPMTFGTTDAFLRQFGIHSIEELPEYGVFAEEDTEEQQSDS